MRPPVFGAKRRLTWPVLGVSMVVFACGLAVMGIALALQQAEVVTTRLMVHARTRAGQIARTTGDLFHHQLNSALHGVAEQIRYRAGTPWIPPPDWPGWIDDLYVWDGATLSLPMSARNAPPPLQDILRSRFRESPPRSPTEPAARRAELMYEPIDKETVVLGRLMVDDASGRPLIIAALLNPDQLKTDLLEPLAALDESLELVPTSEADGPWFQTMAGAMRDWSIQPAEVYVKEQRNNVVGQTLAYLGLTILALATMLAAMWFLARVARREISLAEMKSNFVADVSHELKTPLALIRLFGETLQAGRVATEEKRQEYYAIITRESTRLTNLINNILDFARIEAGREEYSLEPIDLAKVVREVYDDYRAELDHHGFEHQLTIRDGLPPVPADRDSIAQALLNLLSNAVKYSDNEKRVAIEVAPDTRRDLHGVLISVHDRGIGIRPEDRAHIFEGFYRAPDGRVRQQGGTGLGLALVKHIVDAHHGAVEVESRLVKGSTFRIFLPAAKPPRAPGIVSVPRAENGGSC